MTDREEWKAARQWIQVKEKLPENDSDVIIIESGITYLAFYQNGLFLTPGDQPTFMTGEIEYWFPVPELPEEE